MRLLKQNTGTSVPVVGEPFVKNAMIDGGASARTVTHRGWRRYMPSTKIELIPRLYGIIDNEQLTPEQVEKLKQIIIQAQHGFYDDFESGYAMPKVQLVLELKGTGIKSSFLDSVVHDVLGGVYDENV